MEYELLVIEIYSYMEKKVLPVGTSILMELWAASFMKLKVTIT